MLISKLLDDHRDALKAKEGEVADLRQEVEELSAMGKVATEEISWHKVYLDHKAMVRSSREKKVAQLRGEIAKKGSEMLKGDSEL